MAYRDMNGNITINENAANADIKRLCAAKQYLVDSENAINSLIKQAADGQGETATAVVEKANELKMQIDKLSKRCYRELSGGQQQRVLLARALCATQKMLLLDEPVSGLDPKVTAEMYRLIDELNHRDGITIIMISHDIAAAVKYASHILHIGDTVFFGTRADYLQSPQGRLFDAKKGGDIQ